MRHTDREARLHRLIGAGRALLSEFDVDPVLARLLGVARELTGARYAALGVLDDGGREIERFLTHGIGPATHTAIGDPPRGRGVLGLLIEDPHPLRLKDLREHPRSYGFPAGHPPMRGFLGVPILIGDVAWGNLYLTDKAGGDFDADDEETATILASWAAIAIEHARLHQRLRQRHDALERTVRNFQATTNVTRAVGADTDLGRVLELIVKRGRAVAGARALLIVLREDEDLSIAAAAGDVDSSVVGERIPVKDTTADTILREIKTERSRDVARRLRVTSDRLGVPMTSDRLGVHDPHAALVVPLEFRGRRLGVLLAFDRIGETAFDAEQQTLLLAFAASAATAVATAQSVERERLRDTMASAERERTRWAHELHDETLQGLASLRMLVDRALADADPAAQARALRVLGERIDGEVAKLRALIAELRPAALDAHGLRPAIERLAAEVSSAGPLNVEAAVRLQPDADERRLAPETETAVYRVVQEALANVVKHADASRVSIEVAPCEGGIDVTVRDDGAGFDTEAPRDGYGIAGMAERAELADGTLVITSRPGAGTTVHAWLRADQRAAA
jgi:signal transduction histidine kinase